MSSSADKAFNAMIRAHVEMDWDEYMYQGMERRIAIGKIAKDWYLSHQEVVDMINRIEKDAEDIDNTGDLGEII